MNIDLSIHRLAYGEADTLGVAQALVARKRQELDLRLLREQVQKDEATTGASIDKAIKDMEAHSAKRRHDPADDTGALIDKTA
jgi:hypothetical protein